MSIDCYCDYDAPSVFSERCVKARKPHKCTECNRVINPGESYHYAFGVWDGCADTFHTCSHCTDIKQFVRNSVPCFCWAYGNMLDDAREAIQEAYWRAGDEVRGLFFGFGRRLIKARRARKAVAI